MNNQNFWPKYELTMWRFALGIILVLALTARVGNEMRERLVRIESKIDAAAVISKSSQ